MNELKKTIIRKITPKQNDFLDFVEKEMPYGKCLLIIHAGEPQKVEDVKPTKIFSEKTVVDKHS